jgi:hypothetical protein
MKKIMVAIVSLGIGMFGIMGCKKEEPKPVMPKTTDAVKKTATDAAKEADKAAADAVKKANEAAPKAPEAK